MPSWPQSLAMRLVTCWPSTPPSGCPCSTPPREGEPCWPSCWARPLRKKACCWQPWGWVPSTECCCLRSEEHTSELQSRGHLVCRLLLEKKNTFEAKDNRCSVEHGIM